MSRALRSTAGFTMVEILVSLVILSFGTMVLGQLMFQGSKASRVRSTATYRTAALTQEVERLGVIPFDMVIVGSSCTTVSAGAFPHSLCTTVTSISTVSRQVTVVVTPTGSDVLPPDTAVLVRTDPVRVEPLSTP
jgi:prepilin-type N-terminal cleavage/methylation domain-containing protein